MARSSVVFPDPDGPTIDEQLPDARRRGRRRRAPAPAAARAGPDMLRVRPRTSTAVNRHALCEQRSCLRVEVGDGVVDRVAGLVEGAGQDLAGDVLDLRPGRQHRRPAHDRDPVEEHLVVLGRRRRVEERTGGDRPQRRHRAAAERQDALARSVRRRTRRTAWPRRGGRHPGRGRSRRSAGSSLAARRAAAAPRPSRTQRPRGTPAPRAARTGTSPACPAVNRLSRSWAARSVSSGTTRSSRTSPTRKLRPHGPAGCRA